MACLLIVCSAATAQTVVSEKKWNPTDVVDEQYGITLYAPMIERLDGDSVRRCGDSKCNGWVEDYYENGQLMHRGYYNLGHLTLFKNYYPDGTLERSFKCIDDYKSVLKTYYPSGSPRSEVKYQGSDAMKWTDYYANGNMEYQEVYDRKLEFFTERSSYYENGQPENLLVLEKKKDHLYTETVYHPNGQIKEQGAVQYYDELMDYIRIKVWKVYDENGTLIKEQDYVYGKVNSEKTF